MYINTNMMKCHTQSGWWRPVKNVKITGKLEYRPEFTTKNGAKTMMRWARRGFCDRPTGEYASFFRMHMWNVEASYIAMLVKPSGFAYLTVDFFNAALARRMFREESTETLKLKLGLLAASQDAKADTIRVSAVRKTYNSESYEVQRRRKLAGTLWVGHDNPWSRTYRYGEAIADITKSTPVIIDHIGSPLSDRQLTRFEESIHSPLTMRFTIDDGGLPGSSYNTHTTILGAVND